jgi:hypothetical protein
MKMQKYSEEDHETGVVAYGLGENSITILFQEGWFYLYDGDKPGMEQVNDMKALALKGRGLSTYISQHVRENYKRKWREH